MNDATGGSLSLTKTLDDEINRLNRLTRQIQDILFNCESTIPTHVLDNLAQLNSGLIHVSKLVAQRESGHENLLALVDISQVVNSTLELNEVLRTVMDTIIRLTRAERGFLMLRDEQGNLSIRIARNWEQESIEPSEFAISRTIVNRVISEGAPVLTTNAQEDPRFDRQESIVVYNLRSILCVPLKVKDELTGVLYADNRIRAGIFTETERDLLTAFANQAAVAIENARLFESVRRTLAEVSQLKNLMDDVFASIASGVITTDPHERITLSNRSAAAILGKPGINLAGSRLEEVLHPIAAELSRNIQAVWRANQQILGLEFNTALPGRGPVTLSLNLAPLKDASQATQGITIVLDDLTDKKRLEGRWRLFERMVSPEVIKQLDPDMLQLGGQRADITTLFADIRGFTSFSESLPPERLVAVLNRYLAAAADAVLAQEGTIDKFLGDAIMAWFNAPIPQPDHTLRAVRAALEIQKAVEGLKRQLPPEYRLTFGAGIHYGEAVLGLVGTEKRLEYTAIGDSINTAKRIQENAAGGQILVSEAALACLKGQVRVRQVEPVLAKGKSQPIKVFEVVGLA